MVKKIAYRAVNGKPEILEYTLVRSSRRTIGIGIHPDGKVTVRVPRHVTVQQAEEMLNRKLDWVLKHKQRFEEAAKRAPAKKLAHSEKQLFLGEEHTLRVTIDPGARNEVAKNGNYIDISCKDETWVEPLLEHWLHEQAKKKFPAIIAPLLEQFKEKYRVSPTKITIRWMKSRWGSCSSKRSISLNSRLVMASPRCLEHVFAHELCHLIHMNHSKNYYDTLSEFMPDWKERKRMLEQQMGTSRI